MGCCLSSESTQGRQSVATGKPFKRSNIQWTSDVPITHARLLEQRNTFWETAPFYEGRPEIWQALQAATTSDDIILAQSILDAANITLPTGNPADGIYDELGTRYEIPLYCLVDPTNVIADGETDLGQQHQQQLHPDDQPCGMSSAMTQTTSATTDLGLHNSGRGHQKTISSVSSIADTPMQNMAPPQQQQQQDPTNMTNPVTSDTFTNKKLTTTATPITGDHPVIIRLSTGKDIHLKISSTQETVPILKSRIYADAESHLSPDTHLLRLIYLGKILDDHTSIIGDFTLTPTPPLEKNTIKLRAGAVIQALVVSVKS
ncbi:hypothetical protein BCR42DRAFT_424323 [Absidia repens]|uniref:DC-UbP/UBTD2 N-terminal domain-containing protein n=1 Tax=Absidia repens TaxID=90262 RepID=A0A1X2I5M5_9FUNG|nr:hypothetical protein BCR42DRAFT_424323 [Absidia repens]